MLIAIFHFSYFKFGYVYPLQCRIGKKQVLDAGNPTLFLGEGVVSKSLSTLSFPIVVKKGEEVADVSYRLTLLSLAP